MRRAGTGRGRKRRQVLLGAGALLLCLAAAGGCRSIRAGRTGPEVCFPLQGAQWRLSAPYGWRTDPITGQRAFHQGIDLACPQGTPVAAAMEGVVTTARQSTSYGNYLCLAHPGGRETRYAHLQYLFVRPGQVVQAGQLLGTAGNTGRSTGAHLHFELLVQGQHRAPGTLRGLP